MCCQMCDPRRYKQTCGNTKGPLKSAWDKRKTSENKWGRKTFP